MATTSGYTIDELAKIVGGTARGDGRGDTGVRIRGVADLAEAGPDQASWVTSGKYAAKLATSRAGVVLVGPEHETASMPAIVCDRVDQSVARLLEAFAPPRPQIAKGVHPTAVVHDSAALGPDVSIGPHVVIEAGAQVGARSVLHSGVYVGAETSVGADCLIWPGVVIRERCRMGNRVEIHPNAVIGADGFGFYLDEGRHRKIPHIGGVVIEDDVEVGACTCIDRSKFGDTIVGRGTKIDNLVQIAHNVRIGAHCVFAGHSGVSGSVRIGDNCIFGGRASLVDNVTIGDGARFAVMSLATHDISPGTTVSGIPAQDHRTELRERASLRRLPALAEQVRALLARVERLEASADHQRRR